MKMTTFALLTVAAVTAAACENKDPLREGFGNSVRHNMAVHIINPRPKYDVDALSGLSGPRAAGALGRYEHGEVEKLKIEKTSKKAASE